jgi:hypothetical protein
LLYENPKEGEAKLSSWKVLEGLIADIADFCAQSANAAAIRNTFDKLV